MSKGYTGNLKQYILLSEAWYAKAVLEGRREDCLKKLDDVMFGFYGEKDTVEMGVYWYQLEDGEPLGARLECFSVSWQALAQLKDVIDAMAEVDGQDITPKEFCALLERCGFSDATPRERKGAE